MKIKPLHFMFVTLMLPLSVAACGSVAPAEGKMNDELSAEGATAEAQDSLLGMPDPNPCRGIIDPEDFSIYFPNPFHCNQFFECSVGKSILFTCPDGLLFNSKLNVCDWPENVVCGMAPSPSSP